MHQLQHRGVRRGARDARPVHQGAGVVAQPDELFRDDWQERINTFLHGRLREPARRLRERQVAELTREHRRELVEALYAEGAFRGKSAANYVANVLGMGRATVYTSST